MTQAAVREMTRRLNEALGQQVRRIDQRTFLVASRTRPGIEYRVDIALDGTPVCSCAAAIAKAEPMDCHHVEKVRRYMTTETTTSRELATIKVTPPPSILPSERDMKAMDYVAAQLAAGGSLVIPIIKDNGQERPMTEKEVRSVIIRGFELGVRPITMLQHSFIVNGKIQVDGELMASIVTSAEPGNRFIVEETTSEKATVMFERPSKGIKKGITVTIADAKKAGLVRDTGNWAKFPADMLRWSAVKRLCRIYAPDLINGLTASPRPTATAEDYDEPDDDGAIEGDFSISELQNEGDPGPSVDDGATEPEQEEEAAESSEPASPAQTPQDRQTLTRELNVALKMLKERDQGAYLNTMKAMRERWPHMIQDNRQTLATLSDEELAEALKLLKQALPTAPVG